MLQAAMEQMNFEEEEYDEYESQETENQEYSSLQQQINFDNNDEDDVLLWDI